MITFVYTIYLNMSKKILFSTEQLVQIKKEYSDNLKSMSEIAKIFSVSISKIKTTLKHLGVSSRNPSHCQIKYSINEKFFDIIDNEEKAYFLGFLYADGYNNTKTNNVVLNLKASDKDILLRLNNLIQPSKSLYFRSMKNQRKVKGYENAQDQYVLTIQNKHVSMQLEKLGCYKNKSLTLKFPTEEQVPSHLIHHFIRGYFDGDGSVNNGILKVSILSSSSFLDTLQSVLSNHISNYKFKKYYKKGKINELILGGRIQCHSFKNYIYNNSTIFLKRKKDIFDTLY